MSMLLFQFDIQTQNEDAEKFTAYTLKTVDTGYNSEEITMYGVQPNSQYIHWKHTDGGAAVSATYAEKYDLHVGDAITLKEAYQDTCYTIKISDIYAYQGALCVFMNQEDLNAMLDYDSAYFSGYLSDTPITDIDEKYISSVIDLDALTKVSRQLDVSMGSMMYLVDGFGIAIFVILMYLLSKIIIEKNAQAISMTKILGYNNREIGGLYLASTSIVVAVLLLCQSADRDKIAHCTVCGCHEIGNDRLDSAGHSAENLCTDAVNWHDYVCNCCSFGVSEIRRIRWMKRSSMWNKQNKKQIAVKTGRFL